MFPAYSANDSPPTNAIEYKPDESGTARQQAEWLKNQSFNQLKIKKETKIEVHDNDVEFISYFEHKETNKTTKEEEDADKQRRKKKHKKKEKKAKKKKRKHSASEESDSSIDDLKHIQMEELLCDRNYLEFFAKFTPDQLKKAYFFEDLPGLTYRNAFRIDKKGDKNNICFDSLHYKQLAKYRVPFEPNITNKIASISKKEAKKMTRKQVRRYIINELKQRRYFVQVNKIKPEADIKIKLPKQQPNTLSDKMWLYLEMKKDFDSNNDIQVDKTAEFMKYLTENKQDIKKWLEFIDYQSVAKQDTEVNQTVCYERKLSIFEKAIKENPASFRLRLELIKLKANSIEFNESINSIDKIESEFIALLFSESSLSNQIISKMKSLDQLKILTNLFEIWFELIKFFTNNSSSNLNFNKIKRIYIKFFQYFLNSSNSIITKNIKSDIFINNILNGLDSYCSFLSRSGYYEKGIAIYQSLLDFNLCTNSLSYKDLDFKSRKSLFELFSEIGLPRFGENLSLGWMNCLENRDNLFKKLEVESNYFRYDDYLDTAEEKIIQMKDIRIEYRWIEIEKLRSTLDWYPFYPKTVIGESFDDCIDTDRLISFEDDLIYLLFDLNEESEHFKFKLLCKFLKYLNLISWDEDVLDLKLVNNTNDSTLNLDDLLIRLALITSNLDEDTEYTKYLTNKFKFMNSTPFNSQDISFGADLSLLKNIFEALFDTQSLKLDDIEQENRVQTLKLLAKNTIDFIRNCLNQSPTSFKTTKYKTSLIILKWNFELHLLQLLNNQTITEDLQKDSEEYFSMKIIKQNLLNKAKTDLSLESNRSNFELWKQYSFLKWLLNHDGSQPINLKENRKVFDNLLATTNCNTLNDCINVYSLCADYISLELEIYYRQFSLETTSLNKTEFDIGFETINIQRGFFDLKQNELKSRQLKKEDYTNMSELLLKHCLNKEIESKSKAKATFQIGISGTTRLLLIKKDFQNEYSKQLNDCTTSKANELYLLQKRFFHFHRVYTMFLICVDDIEKLIELNDSVLKQSNLLFQSKLIEFYLSIINYLYYQQPKITKYLYRAKLFAIIRCIIPLNRLNSNLVNCKKSLIRLIQISLVRFKLKNSNIFCSQLIESNDIDLVLKQMGSSLSFSSSAIVWLSLIFTNINKLEQVLNSFENDQVKPSNIGIHNQIRRQFEQAVKHNPKSFQLWIFYLKFEMKYAQKETSKNRFLYIYYQSIRNLPYCKTLFINAIKCLPEKYNEIMSLIYVKEIRLYLPIQELNILLEPIKNRGDLLDEEFEKSHLGLIDLNVSSCSDDNESDVNHSDTDDESNQEDYEFDSNSSVEKLEFD